MIDGYSYIRFTIFYNNMIHFFNSIPMRSGPCNTHGPNCVYVDDVVDINCKE